MDYADGGDLYRRVLEHQQKGKYMSEGTIWRLVVQLARGLGALHELSVLHRDIKSANVFLCSDGQVKLGDMNVAKVAKAGLLRTQTGTPYYASPEVWQDLPYDSKSDIWSLGCVLYEAAALKPPFRADDMPGLYRKVTKGEFSRIPKCFSQDLASLLEALISVDPTKRPNCHDILQLPQVGKRLPKFKELPKEQRSSSSTLLETIQFPKGLQHLSDRLPRPQYEEIRSSLALPKLSKEELRVKLQIRRKLSAEPTRAKDLSEAQKALRENYSVNRQIHKSHSRSTPLHPAQAKHVHELSLDSILSKPQAGGYYMRARKQQEGRRLVVLRALQREGSGVRLQD